MPAIHAYELVNPHLAKDARHRRERDDAGPLTMELARKPAQIAQEKIAASVRATLMALPPEVRSARSSKGGQAVRAKANARRQERIDREWKREQAGIRAWNGGEFSRAG